MRRDAGEDEHAVQSEHLHHFEGNFRHAQSLINKVDVACQLLEVGQGCRLAGDIFRPDGIHESGFGIRLRGTRVNEGLVAAHYEGHRAKNPDGTGTKHDSGLAGAAAPVQPRLDGGHLGERLLRHGQGFDQHGHVAQLRRHEIEMLLILDKELGHVAVHHLDAALGKISGETKILPAHLARGAMVMRTRPAHAGHDEIADLQPRDARADLHHFAQRLVSEHEIIGAIGWRAVGEGTDFAVGAADAHFDHANLRVPRLTQRGHDVLIEQDDFAFLRIDTDGSHDFSNGD